MGRGVFVSSREVWSRALTQPSHSSADIYGGRGTRHGNPTKETWPAPRPPLACRVFAPLTRLGPHGGLTPAAHYLYNTRRPTQGGNTLVERVPTGVTHYRTRQRLSQTWLATRLGISKPRMSQIESGSMIPTPKEVDRLVEILGVPPSYLFSRHVLSEVAERADAPREALG